MSKENPPPSTRQLPALHPHHPPLPVAALGFQKHRDITYGGQRINKALLNFPLAFMSVRDQACAVLRQGRESRIPAVPERRTHALHVSAAVCNVRVLLQRRLG